MIKIVFTGTRIDERNKKPRSRVRERTFRQGSKPWIFIGLRKLFGGVGCKFPVASITNYDTLGGFEQQKYVLSWIWTLTVGNQFH